MCRAIVSRPDFLMLDEPTNHLDPESIDWVAEFLETYSKVRLEFVLIDRLGHALTRTLTFAEVVSGIG